jgi:4-hydroxy-tetrahydrodipicolinate synthase
MPQPIFNGLSAFPLTPADEAGRVDVDGLQRLLARVVEARAGSIGLLGSTGTYMYLSREERHRAVTAAVECVEKRVPVIVGVGALRTDEAEALARDAAAAGADALLLAPVSYTPLTEEEAFRHFEAVAGATELPLCIYNNPSTTHFSFSETLLQRLASVGNIRAVKMPLPKEMDFTGELPASGQTCPTTLRSAIAATGAAARPCLPGPTAGTAWLPACFRSLRQR